MKPQTHSNLRLGIFVLAGLSLLVVTLYVLGQQRNLFNPVIHVGVSLKNATGLVKGNNVRFAGVNVGTVERITIRNDTAIFVAMVIRKDASPFIKKTALASLGTDGLMGNAVIDLSTVADAAPAVEDGDQLRGAQTLAIADLMHTLGTSGDDLSAITQDLRLFTRRLNQSPVLRRLLTDEVLVTDLHQTTASLRMAGQQIHSAASDIQQLTGHVRAGRGNLGYLLHDTTLVTDLHVAVGSFKHVGNRTDTLVQALSAFTSSLSNQTGALNTVLRDSAFNGQLSRTMGNVEQGTARFSEDMKALQSNFLFRGYFRKKGAL